MKWLFLVLIFGLAFATTTTTSVRIIDHELGYISVTGISEKGDLFEVNDSTLYIKAKSLKEFTVHNYTVSLVPRNLERLAEDFGVPLSGSIDWTVPKGYSASQSVELPDIVCGTYKVTGDLTYSINGTLQTYTDNLKFTAPCKSFKMRLVSGLVARLPYPILKMVAGWFGVQFT
ncbi:MAG: hypothetical protein GOV01_02470 [Candidatus Altiarchaeota archaeon]|nr:hypothetical protein [Candidatus Altiarchaeota archaeon]